jgi:hypothetical protein
MSLAQSSRIDTVELTPAFTHEIVGRAMLHADCNRCQLYSDSDWWLFEPLPAIERIKATYDGRFDSGALTYADIEQALITYLV